MGGGKGGGGGGSSNSVAPNTSLLPSGEAGFNAPIQPYFPGQTVAGFNPNQQNAWQQLQQGAQAGAGAGQDATTAFSDAWRMGSIGNPWLDAQVTNMQNSLNQNFQRNTMPSIASGAAGVGQTGSSRQGVAEGIARGDLDTNIANQTAGMYGNAYNQQLQHFQNMSSQIPSFWNMYSGSQMLPGQVGGAIGGQQQDQAQQLLDAEKERYDYNREAPWDRLNKYAGLIFGTPIGQQQEGSSGGFNFGFGQM